MARVIYISQQYPNLSGFPADWEISRFPHEVVPTIEAAGQADYFLLVGQFDNTTWAEQLAGLLGRVIPEGTVLIVAFPTQVAGAMNAFLARLGIGNGLAANRPLDVQAVHPAFTEYFAVFGQSATMFEPHQEAEVLGQMEIPASGEVVRAAVHVSRERGAIYALPYYFGGAEDQFAPMLAAAITGHRADSAAVLPAFLEELRLPGEQDVLDEIGEVESRLDELRERAGYLEHFRHLLGPRGTGAALETLVIEALNVVLDGTGSRAEDRPDVRLEDFWIVGPDSDDTALAEVKGVNSNVRLQDVNQVDNNREAAGKPPAFPGLLVFNTFRGHDTLAQRALPVADQAIARASNSNVLVLRTIDLYNLLIRKLNGADAGQELVNALGEGGGWLEVTPEASELKRNA